MCIWYCRVSGKELCIHFQLKVLNELILAGGDADTNGAVAGALLGCRLGFSQLPSDA